MLLRKQEQTSERSLICPICGRESGSASGHASHIRTCKRAPSREELEELCDDRWSLHDIQVKYGASHVTVERWLRDYGLSTFWQQGKLRSEDQLDVYPGYAPKRGQGWLQCAEPPDPGGSSVVVPVCPAYEVCQELAMSLGWMLCEAPDQKQMEAMKRRGIDLLQITTELWIDHPEYWTG